MVRRMRLCIDLDFIFSGKIVDFILISQLRKMHHNRNLGDSLNILILPQQEAPPWN